MRKVNNDFGGSLLCSGPNTVQCWEGYTAHAQAQSLREAPSHPKKTMTRKVILSLKGPAHTIVEHTVWFCVIINNKVIFKKKKKEQ